MGILKNSKVIDFNGPQLEIGTAPEIRSEAHSHHEVAVPDVAGDQDLGRVRELLFGPQVREHRAEMTRLAEKVGQQAAAFRDDLEKQVQALNRLVHERTSVAIERTHSEATARKISEEVLTKKFEELRFSIEAKVETLIDRTSQMERDLREHVASQYKLLNDTVSQRHEDVMSLVSAGLEEIRTAKLDRGSFAAMLREMATRFDPHHGS